MRSELKKINQVRGRFTGVVDRSGTKKSFGYIKPTILFTQIKDSAGNIVTDHLWFNLTKGFDSLELQQGDLVEFDARVKRYEKGYRGYRDDIDRSVETDYKLSHPTKIVKIVIAEEKRS